MGLKGSVRGATGSSERTANYFSVLLGYLT
jgi:hypothetical protein